MQFFHVPLSPSGTLPVRPFVIAAVAIYAVGIISQQLTTPGVISRAGLWPFIIVQAALTWVWFAAHAQRLHDAGRPIGAAAGIALLYVLSLVLLLFVADLFFNSSDGVMGDANATSALGVILIVYVVSTLLSTPQGNIAWIVVAGLTLAAFVPICLAVGCTIWAATRPSTKATVA